MKIKPRPPRDSLETFRNLAHVGAAHVQSSALDAAKQLQRWSGTSWSRCRRATFSMCTSIASSKTASTCSVRPLVATSWRLTLMGLTKVKRSIPGIWHPASHCLHAGGPKFIWWESFAGVYLDIWWQNYSLIGLLKLENDLGWFWWVWTLTGFSWGSHVLHRSMRRMWYYNLMLLKILRVKLRSSWKLWIGLLMNSPVLAKIFLNTLS